MQINELRSKYLEFFKAAPRSHILIPSASLVPENDPTTLFTGSGMQPLVPYLLGKDHPEGKRIVNSQKCFRAMDIEEVGDNRHTTFFEMLGNWSLGDYFKTEQLSWFFEFLTKEIGIPQERLWVTCFEGDGKLNLPRDNESAEIWKKLGIPEDRIRFYPSKKNWWSRAGEPQNMPTGEPGGPDSEMFYEFTDVEHDPKFGKECHPNCDCGRFLEIGNSVFMQYIKQADGSFALLPKQNVDFGGGLERIAAVSQNDPDVFKSGAFECLLSAINYDHANPEQKRVGRIVADHLRASAFLIADGVVPSNTDRGYVLRRLIRRAVRYGSILDIESIANHVGLVECQYLDGYANYFTDPKPIREPVTIIREEEERFRATLSRGMKEFDRIAKTDIPGYEAFILFSTYGFPLEMTKEMAAERGISVDEKAFQEEMKKHQEGSRAGSEQKFKGGLADTSEATTRLHTAHHLLLKALQMVLGEHVKQRGSNITGERLRIDFSHPAKMTKEQVAEVERIVNEKIKEAMPVVQTVMPKSEAEKLGAEHEFGAKYPEMVSVYSVGALNDAFSIEFCGGPHVSNTKELKGTFKIQKEEAVAAGIRRIKAVLG